MHRKDPNGVPSKNNLTWGRHGGGNEQNPRGCFERSYVKKKNCGGTQAVS